MADKPETLPEPDFRLKWRDGAYYVTKPNIGDTDCYTASTLGEAIKGARLKAIQAAYDAMFDAKGCKACRFDAQTAIRKLMEDEQ